MLLIPAIDLKDGRCVRLKQGDMNDSTTFGEDPAAMARRWLDAGARRLFDLRVQLLADQAREKEQLIVMNPYCVARFDDL